MKIIIQMFIGNDIIDTYKEEDGSIDIEGVILKNRKTNQEWDVWGKSRTIDIKPGPDMTMKLAVITYEEPIIGVENDYNYPYMGQFPHVQKAMTNILIGDDPDLVGIYIKSTYRKRAVMMTFSRSYYMVDFVYDLFHGPALVENNGEEFYKKGEWK